MKEKLPRRKFFAGLFGLSIPALGAAEHHDQESVKMLTEDGELVEVPKGALKGLNPNKIEKEELLQWAKKRKPS